jgi:hypothetical protein
MEKLITINSNHNSLDKLAALLSKELIYDCSKEYDIWEMRTDANGQMEQCLIVKKSNMHAVKLFFVNENTIKVSYIIPNKIMQAYFGKSVKARRNIIEIIAGGIKQVILAGPQQKAFDELEQSINKIIA